MTAHIGVDADSVTHSLEISTAKLHDSQIWAGCCMARKPRSRPTKAIELAEQGRLPDCGQNGSGAGKLAGQLPESVSEADATL
jgi:hypothetical protein